MKYSKLIFLKDLNYFSIIVSSDPKIEMIADFLRTEARANAYDISSFVNDQTRNARGGDVISLDKEGDNIIIDNIRHNSDEDHEDRVVMHKYDFLSMLHQWEKVYSQRPDEIIITQDDASKISIIGKFADGREI